MLIAAGVEGVEAGLRVFNSKKKNLNNDYIVSPSKMYNDKLTQLRVTQRRVCTNKRAVIADRMDSLRMDIDTQANNLAKDVNPVSPNTIYRHGRPNSPAAGLPGLKLNAGTCATLSTPRSHRPN